MSPSVVSIKCTQPTNGWASNNFKVDITATGGDTDCSASSAGSANVTVLTKPVVKVQGPAKRELCNDRTSLSFDYTVSSGASQLPLTVTATASDASVECGTSPASPGGLLSHPKNVAHFLWLHHLCDCASHAHDFKNPVLLASSVPSADLLQTHI